VIGAALLFVAGTMVVIGFILDVFAARVAPLGYEDETGFHVGTRDGVDEDGLVWPNPS